MLKKGILGVTIMCLSACGSTAEDDHGEHEHKETTELTAWYFGSDSTSNSWNLDISGISDFSTLSKSTTFDDLSALSASEDLGGNGQGPTWNDALLSSDGKRIFANARSVNKVAVFDVETRSLETILDVGERPVHMFNPNHGNEIWVHADGPGSFYIIDQTTLAVSEPVVAALEDTGHGKLLYAKELGTKYYATNTNDPGIFPIDGAARTSGTMIQLCDSPCEDDTETADVDESTETCGGTHDKAYNPVMKYVVVQCSGSNRGKYAFVDAETDEVVQDLVEISGSITHSTSNEYILSINGDQVQIWDTGKEGHDGIAFDATVTVDGKPSARGTVFAQNAQEQWEAWIPQTEGTKVAILNLTTLEIAYAEIGTLTEPAGASHFSRRAGLVDGKFLSYNDDGTVLVDMTTREVTLGAALGTLPSRVVGVSQTVHHDDHDS